MGSEQQNNYYNEVYTDNQKYDCHYLESVYLPLWEEVLKILPKDSKILGIGCGTGQFQQMLHDNGYENYEGLDFSEVAIEKARLKSPYIFYCDNVYNLENYDNYDTITALEILEHIDDDKVMKKIKPGTLVVFTVPEFDDPAHVRFFKNEHEVYNRYWSYFDRLQIQKVGRWFMCYGRTK